MIVLQGTLDPADNQTDTAVLSAAHSVAPMHSLPVWHAALIWQPVVCHECQDINDITTITPI